MRIKLLFISIFLSSIVSIFANSPDSVKTYYKDGQFTTICKTWVNTNDSVMTKLVKDYVFQSKYDLDKLFGWALKGMKLRNEGDDLIVMNFKSTRYDPLHDLIRGKGDVEIPGLIKFPDIHVDSRMTYTQLTNKTLKVKTEVMYSDAFLKKASGVFYAIPVKNKGYWMTLETNIQFGWFFNVFITQPMFRYIMEWRFSKMLSNIKEEAERRTKLLDK